MAVESTTLASLFEKLKAEDPCLPPRTWESIPSQSGSLPPPRASASPPLSSAVSETSLVRLALNALQGVQSSLISIQKLSDAFCSEPTDRTFHQIQSLWNRSLSTDALGKILKSIGSLGSVVFLLYKFVDHFTNPNMEERTVAERWERRELEENQNLCDSKFEGTCNQYGFVNQAFAIAVRNVLEGYMLALHTSQASVRLRRSARNTSLPHQESDEGLGCLSDVGYSELTLLEVFLHTRELRTQIEALGNICNLNALAFHFYAFSVEDLQGYAIYQFRNFFRGAELLSYLYSQLKVADPAHLTLLKYLFLRSCEPYCAYIRSWIFKAEIKDPYNEFMVEYTNCCQPHSQIKHSASPLASVRVRDKAVSPCFLKGFLAPLVRAGQQLQVLMKLFERFNFMADSNLFYGDLLPCWSGYSENCPLTFSKVDIEAMVQRRENYYKMILEKLKNFSRGPEFYSEKVTAACSSLNPNALGREGLESSVLLTSNDSLVILPAVEKSTNKYQSDVNKVDHNATEECSSNTDASELSECPSVSDSEVEIEPESPNRFSKKYLATLNFSKVAPVIKSQQLQPLLDRSCDRDINFSDTCRGTDWCCWFKERGHNANDRLMDAELREASWLCMNVKCVPNEPWLLGGLSRNPFSINGIFTNEVRSYLPSGDPVIGISDTGFLENDMKCLGGTLASESTSKNERCLNNMENIFNASLSLADEWKFNYTSNFLSRNPMLTKTNIFKLTSKREEGRRSRDGKYIPVFNFSVVDNPCNICVDKFAVDPTDELFVNFRSHMASPKVKHHSKLDYGGAKVLDGDRKSKALGCHQPFCLEDSNNDGPPNAVGGTAWESLLGRLTHPDTGGTRDQEQSSLTTFGIPIDFVVEKCLLQEILLQYKFVSKLTIKLLEQEFGLQEHLLALRRYHFMELADWADLFIMSLWKHRWSAAEADQRVAEIQSLLELSIQKSSCEYDSHKDRLFVYIRGQGTMPPSSATGIHSFDFFGLGYQVHWPVNIILTPRALKIYADVYTFLIQVKLALFSLTDMWCSLKDLRDSIRKTHQTDSHKQKIFRFNILMKLRYQINHFVSSLQQYVQSELSHVSWSKFLDSLQHKVKDMMDLESVHMNYLTESLNICFLSDETRSISAIVESVLQCALDFQFCFTGATVAEGADQDDLLAKLSGINLSQVQAIKHKFDKSMRELHLCYLKSPKHREFGLFRFWSYLNFSEYYSEFFNESNNLAFVM